MSLTIRLKHLVAFQGPVIAIALAVVSVVAFAGAISAYTSPNVVEVTEETHKQEVGVATETSAVVTGESPLYEQGTELTNEPVYFHSASPELELRIRTTVPADHAVRVSQRVVLEKRAARDDRAFWKSREVLATTDREVTDGHVTVTATFNASDVAADLQAKRSAIGGVGTVRAVLYVRTAYETNRYAGTLNASAPVVFTERAYWIDGTVAANRTHTTPTTRTVTTPPERSSYLWPALGGVLALGTAAAVIYLYRQGIDVELAAVELAHSRYREWISSGAFPTKTEKTYVRVDTLEDLVDIAIDSNKRVIHDDEYDAYAVVDGDLVYYFALEEERLQTWLTMST